MNTDDPGFSDRDLNRIVSREMRGVVNAYIVLQTQHKGFDAPDDCVHVNDAPKVWTQIQKHSNDMIRNWFGTHSLTVTVVTVAVVTVAVVTVDYAAADQCEVAKSFTTNLFWTN